MKFDNFVEKYIIDLSAKIALIPLFGIVVITGYEVVARYIFNSPTIWTVPFGIFFLIWAGFLSLAYVEKENAHVRVDLLTINFSEKTQVALDFATTFLFLISVLFVFYYSIDFTYTAIKMNEVTPGLIDLPIWPVKISVSVGLFLLALWLLIEIKQKTTLLIKYLKENENLFRLISPIVVLLVMVIFSCFLILKVNPLIGLGLLLITLLFSGLPVFPSLLFSGITGVFLLFNGLNGPLTGIIAISYNALYSFSLVCLPMFIIAGTILSITDVGREIYDFLRSWLNWLPGAEGVSTIVACTVFAAISASSVATAATMGIIALPILMKYNYDSRLSYGLLASGGTLGIMIPPSASMIAYSMVTQESLGKLFMAGLIPGLILMSSFSVWIMIKHGKPKIYNTQKPTWHEKITKLKTALWGLSVPLIIIGGIFSGVFTPLESGAMAVIYTFLMVLIRGKVKLKDIVSGGLSSLRTTSMIFGIIIGALVLGYLVTLMQIPDKISSFIIGNNIEPWVAIIMMLTVFIIMGLFLEVWSIMLITMPIFYPLAMDLGVNGIWFAVMATLTMEMALITPPVGLNNFVIKGIADAPLKEIAIGIVPFFVIMTLGLVVFAMFPQLSIWLPNLLVGK